MQDARECKPIVRRRLSMDDLSGEPRGSAIPSRGDASKVYPFVGVSPFRLVRVRGTDSRPFRKGDGSGRSVFGSEERPLLIPLPETAYEMADWTYGRKARSNCHVAYAHNTVWIDTGEFNMRQQHGRSMLEFRS